MKKFVFTVAATAWTPQRLVLLSLAIAASLSGNPAHAANTSLFWEANGTTEGGSGTWDAGVSQLTWNTSATTGTAGLYNNASPSSITAVFAGTAGTVSLATGAQIFANTLTFSVAGYTIAPTTGDTTALLTLNGTSPAINFTGGGATISANLAGTNLTLTGSGTNNLALNGNNSGINGTTILNGGVVGDTTAIGVVVNNAVNNGFGSSTIQFNSTAQVNFRNAGDNTTSTQALTYGNNVVINGGNGEFNVGQTTGGSSSNKTFSFGTLTFNTANAFIFAGNLTNLAPADRISFTGVSLGANGTLEMAATGGTSTVGAVTQTGANDSLTVSDESGITGGTIILSGTNTYTGTTTITGATLQLGTGSTIGSLSTSSTIIDNGILSFDRSNAVVQGTDFSAGIISGSGGLSQVGSGTLTLNALNTYTGATSVSGGGTLSIASDANIGATNGTISIKTSATNSTTVTLNSATLPAGFVVGSVLLGSTVTAISGTTVTLSGDANTTITTATSEGFATEQTLTLNGGTFQVTGTFSMTQTNATGVGATANRAVALGTGGGTFDVTGGNTLTVPGVVSGTGALVKIDAGTLVLSGANTYSGTTTVSGGTLSVSNIVVSGGASNLGNATSAVVLSGGGDLSYSGTSATYTRGFTLGTGGGEVDTTTAGQTLTIGGTTAITGAGNAFTVGGAGNTTITSNITTTTGTVTKIGAGTLTLSGANTYTGGTNINGGDLSLGSTGAIGTAGTISFGGGTLQFSAANTTDYSSRFSNAAGQAYSIDTNGQAVTFATSLTSVGGTFTLDDTNATPGILTFTVVNSYNGLTSVDNGELNLDKANGVTVAGALTVGDGVGAVDTAIVKLLASNQIGTGSAITINSDGRLDLNDFTDQVTSFTSVGGDIGSSTAGGDLTVTGATTFDGAGNTIDAGTTVTTSGTATLGSAATLAVNGTLVGGLTVGNGTLSGTGSVTGNATVDGGTVDLGSGGSIGGTLGVTGGDWSGAGSVTGLVTSSSGDFNIDTSADLTAHDGVDITGGTLSSTDSTGTITGSVDYTSSSSSTYGGVVAGNTNTVTLNNAAATLDFTGANTYGGGTIVEAGHFEVNNTSGSGTGSGSVDVQSGASLGGGNETGGTTSVGGATLGVYAANVQGIISGGVTIESGAHLAPGNSVGTLSVGSLTLSSGSIADYEFNATANDFTSVTGLLTLNGGGFNLYQEGTTNAFAEVGTYNLMSYGSLAGSLVNLSVLNQQAGFTYTFFDDTADDTIQLDITSESVVPEPSTWALMFGGIAVLLIVQRRKRHQS